MMIRRRNALHRFDRLGIAAGDEKRGQMVPKRAGDRG
jgi:hypothetical protein